MDNRHVIQNLQQKITEKAASKSEMCQELVNK